MLWKNSVRVVDDGLLALKYCEKIFQDRYEVILHSPPFLRAFQPNAVRRSA